MEIIPVTPFSLEFSKGTLLEKFKCEATYHVIASLLSSPVPKFREVFLSL